MHYYGIITTLPFSKYASPIFAQRKPNGRLRLLVDLTEINNLIADDYTNNNHPVSTLSDAAQHLAGKELFCKLDCSQAYHVLQMADKKSVKLLVFNFPVEQLLTCDSHKVSAGPSPPSRDSWENISIESSKLTNSLSTSTTSGLPPTTLRSWRPICMRFFSASEKQDCVWQWPNASSAPRKSNSLGEPYHRKGGRDCSTRPKDPELFAKIDLPESRATKKGLQRYIGFVN